MLSSNPCFSLHLHPPDDIAEAHGGRVRDTRSLSTLGIHLALRGIWACRTISNPEVVLTLEWLSAVAPHLIFRALASDALATTTDHGAGLVVAAVNRLKHTVLAEGDFGAVAGRRIVRVARQDFDGVLHVGVVRVPIRLVDALGEDRGSLLARISIITRFVAIFNHTHAFAFGIASLDVVAYVALDASARRRAGDTIDALGIGTRE